MQEMEKLAQDALKEAELFANAPIRDIQTFTIDGVATISADITDSNQLPLISFVEGKQCHGLPRHYEEVDEMGYCEGELAFANFVHECIHLFLAHKLGYLKESIQWIAAHGGTFSTYDEIMKASAEECMILGFQVAVNDVIGDLVNTPKVKGFTLHLAYACQEYARGEIEKYGFNFNELVNEFKNITW